MAIKVIDNEKDIYITQDEYDQYLIEWRTSNKYTVLPSSFESFVRSKRKHKDASHPSKAITNL